MSYQILYVPAMNKKYKRTRNNETRIAKWLFMPLIVGILITCISVRPVREWLFPGNPDVTDAAVQRMVESLRDGNGIGDAVSAFCLEVLRNGEQD